MSKNKIYLLNYTILDPDLRLVTIGIEYHPGMNKTQVKKAFEPRQKELERKYNRFFKDDVMLAGNESCRVIVNGVRELKIPGWRISLDKVVSE